MGLLSTAKKNAKEEVRGFWDTEKQLGGDIVLDGAKACIRAKLTVKDNKAYLDVRKFVNDKGKDKGYGQHTSHGISLALGNAKEMDELISLMIKARGEIYGKKAR